MAIVTMHVNCATILCSLSYVSKYGSLWKRIVKVCIIYCRAVSLSACQSDRQEDNKLLYFETISGLGWWVANGDFTL